MDKFKLGDKVLVKGSKSLASRELKGQIGTIIQVLDFSTAEGGYCIKLDIEKSGPGGMWPEDVELAQSYINEQRMKKELGIK